jgi:leishmanolysin
VTTPRVAQLSKRYFGCSSLQGAEIEDDGGAGSAGSHWERRIFGNEMLTASDVPDPRFSSFTLALLEDSGWYKTDYSKADTLEFGRDTGCSFHFDECINRATKKSRFPEFCDSPNQDMCTFDHTSKGKCLAGYGNYITYDYMGDGTQGTDPYADECFTVTPYTNNGDCRKTGTSSPYQPEVYGPNSRCFAGTLMNPRYSLSGAKSISGCYTHQCQVQGGMTRLIIQVGGTSITCPLGGGPTQAIKGSYEGYLICPHEKYVCKSAPINPNFIAL